MRGFVFLFLGVIQSTVCFLQNAKTNDLIIQKEYLNIAKEVADQYVAKRHFVNRDGAKTATEALRSFSGPGQETRKLIEQTERLNAELEALLMLMTNEDRDLRGVDLETRASEDPLCSLNIDCTNSANLNIVDGREFRTINGMCNNKGNFSWGMATTQHRRLLPNAYANGQWDPRVFSVTSTRRPRLDVRLPSPRNISNVVHSSARAKSSSDQQVSLALFYFMQFVDHDLAKTPEGRVPASRNCCSISRGFCMPLMVDVPDDYFPVGTCMDARRSFTVNRCKDTSGFQNQVNEITSYLDASMVYGSTPQEMETLRSFHAGHLSESTREFMPNSTRPSELACNVTGHDLCYEAGDTRADVHPGLTTYHTVFVREHNRVAKQLALLRGEEWNDERIFQEARKIVGAEIQNIVFNEMLPVLFRDVELVKYRMSAPYSYDKTIDASMTQAFSMAYRYHYLMPDQLHLARLGQSATVEDFSLVKQEQAFLKPSYLSDHHYNGINEVALGMVRNSCPYVNRMMNNSTRNLLFLDNQGKSFDLASLNIARGREWGMPSYTEFRAFCGLGKAVTWSDLLNTTNQEDIDRMAAVYADVRDVDLWTGVVTERPLGDSISGATQTCLVGKHFANLKHGDRFWYETTFSDNQLQEIRKMTLAKVLCKNLDVGKMRTSVFRTNSTWVDCSTIVASNGGDMAFSSW